MAGDGPQHHLGLEVGDGHVTLHLPGVGAQHGARLDRVGLEVDPVGAVPGGADDQLVKAHPLAANAAGSTRHDRRTS